jgi:hypothetical protein
MAAKADPHDVSAAIEDITRESKVADSQEP